jgi:hypothetical protein
LSSQPKAVEMKKFKFNLKEQKKSGKKEGRKKSKDDHLFYRSKSKSLRAERLASV